MARWWRQDVARVNRLPWNQTLLLASEMNRVEALRRTKRGKR